MVGRLGRVLRGIRPASEVDQEAGGDRREAPHAPQADAAPQAPPTSLVQYRRIGVPEVDTDDEPSEIRVIGADEVCPKQPWLLVADDDPTLRFPISCDAYGCEVCGQRKARQAAAIGTWAIRHAKRARFVTLTQAPEDWQLRRQKMRNLRRYLTKRGFRWEMAWSTERGSETGMIHVHGLQHGGFVPQRLLQEVWGARVDIRQIKSGGVAQYVTKDALQAAGYIVKEATAEHGGLYEHLALNGGRALHWSRGFLHGLTKAEALKDLRAELSDGERHSWHRVAYDPDKEPKRDDPYVADWMV